MGFTERRDTEGVGRDGVDEPAESGEEEEEEED